MIEDTRMENVALFLNLNENTKNVILRNFLCSMRHNFCIYPIRADISLFSSNFNSLHFQSTRKAVFRYGLRRTAAVLFSFTLYITV